MAGDRRMGRSFAMAKHVAVLGTGRAAHRRAGSSSTSCSIPCRCANTGSGSTIMEPFTFRLLLRCGAMPGWFACLGGGQQWGRQHRFGPTNEQ